MNDRDIKVITAAQNILSNIRSLSHTEARDALSIANSLLESSESEKLQSQFAQQIPQGAFGITGGKALV